MKDLYFVTCDDWLIISKRFDEKVKRWYYYATNTEMWPEWADFSLKQQQEHNAVAKYMLPIAFKKWDRVYWKGITEKNCIFCGR